MAKFLIAFVVAAAVAAPIVSYAAPVSKTLKCTFVLNGPTVCVPR